MYDNDMSADMDPRLQAALEQMMAGPVRSNVWLAMIPHAARVVNCDDPSTVANEIDQIASALADRYMDMVARENEESERNAAEAAPKPFKFNGADM